MTLHLLIPAAGRGRRFGSTTAKQYHQLGGRMIAEWTLDVWRETAIDGRRLLILAEQDAAGRALAEGDPSFDWVPGGRERADSVLAGLDALDAGADDWVMVHDIARPCVRVADIEALRRHCRETGEGAILARPLTDSIKRRGAGRLHSLDRRELWAALTPQCFPVEPLRAALRQALAGGETLTDEAAAMERIDYPVGLVEGAADNLKLTRAEDLALVECHLRAQGRLS